MTTPTPSPLDKSLERIRQYDPSYPDPRTTTPTETCPGCRRQFPQMQTLVISRERRNAAPETTRARMCESCLDGWLDWMRVKAITNRKGTL